MTNAVEQAQRAAEGDVGSRLLDRLVGQVGGYAGRQGGLWRPGRARRRHRDSGRSCPLGLWWRWRCQPGRLGLRRRRGRRGGIPSATSRSPRQAPPSGRSRGPSEPPKSSVAHSPWPSSFAPWPASAGSPPAPTPGSATANSERTSHRHSSHRDPSSATTSDKKRSSGSLCTGALRSRHDRWTRAPTDVSVAGSSPLPDRHSGCSSARRPTGQPRCPAARMTRRRRLALQKGRKRWQTRTRFGRASEGVHEADQRSPATETGTRFLLLRSERWPRSRQPPTTPSLSSERAASCPHRRRARRGGPRAARRWRGLVPTLCGAAATAGHPPTRPCSTNQPRPRARSVDGHCGSERLGRVAAITRRRHEPVRPERPARPGRPSRQASA